jgi:hypothetical protein
MVRMRLEDDGAAGRERGRRVAAGGAEGEGEVRGGEDGDGAERTRDPPLVRPRRVGPGGVDDRVREQAGAGGVRERPELGDGPDDLTAETLRRQARLLLGDGHEVRGDLVQAGGDRLEKHGVVEAAGLAPLRTGAQGLGRGAGRRDGLRRAGLGDAGADAAAGPRVGPGEPSCGALRRHAASLVRAQEPT